LSPSIVLSLQRGSQNHTVTAGKGSNIQKMLENRITRTAITKQKIVDPQVTTRKLLNSFIFINSVIFLSFGHLLCKISYSGQY